jgi:hypothetical protein
MERGSVSEKTKSRTRKTKGTLIYFDSRQRYINPKNDSRVEFKKAK